MPTFHCSVCPEGLQPTLHDRNQGFEKHGVYWQDHIMWDFHITEKRVDKERVPFNLDSNLWEDQVFVLLITASPWWCCSFSRATASKFGYILVSHISPNHILWSLLHCHKQVLNLLMGITGFLSRPLNKTMQPRPTVTSAGGSRAEEIGRRIWNFAFHLIPISSLSTLGPYYSHKLEGRLFCAKPVCWVKRTTNIPVFCQAFQPRQRQEETTASLGN